MSSFEAVIDRMKQEGNLDRNSGTNSIKSLKERLDSSNIILSSISKALKKNVVGGTSSIPLLQSDSQQSLQKEGATSELSKESSIFKLLGAVTKFQAMRPIGAIGGAASSIGSSLKEKSGINSFQKAFSDKLENLKSSLFQAAGGKEEETSSDIEETLSENLSSDGPIVSAIETQTAHIEELVGLFKDFIFQGRQSELERRDLASEAQSPEQPTIVEEERESGSGIFGKLFGSIIKGFLSLGRLFLPLLTPLLGLLANPAVLGGIAALTAAVALFLNREKIANLISEFFKSNPERVEANTKRQEKTLAEAEKTVSKLEKKAIEKPLDSRETQELEENKRVVKVVEQKLNAKDIVASLTATEVKEGMSEEHRLKMDRKGMFTTGPLKGMTSMQAAGAFKQAEATRANLVPQAVPPQIQSKPPITLEAAQIAESSKTQNSQNVTVVAPTNNVSAPSSTSITTNVDKSVSIGTAQPPRMSEFGGMWNSMVAQ